MSHENEETLRRVLDAIDRGDRAAYLALCDPNHEVVPVDDWPEGGPIRGPEAVWDFYARVAEAFEPFGSDDAEFSDAGNNKMVIHRGAAMHGRTSGAEVELDYWAVVTFRKGKLLRDEWFTDRAAAVEAAGLSE